ncbi:MAG: hypothetical protein LW870_07570 [Pirellula sp.]|nr:hypothetical protein [Pirellula sp.]
MNSKLMLLFGAMLLTTGILTTLCAQEVSVPPQNDSVFSNNVEPPDALETASSYSLIPYRRIYLQPDLLQKVIGDRDYTPSDLNQSATLLKSYNTDAETAAIYRMAPELESMFYTARLIGTNLVSDASRICMNRGSYIGERFSLFPLSLHLRPSAETKTNQEPNEAALQYSRIGFDREGRASVGLHRTDTKLASEKLSIPFGWTLKSEMSFAQNHVFRVSLPSCPNSLLLLALPKNSRVHDANVPVFEVAQWLDLQPRLGDWASDAKLALDRIAADTPDLSIWLFELGGVQSLSFSVSSHVADSAAQEGNRINRFDELVLSQKIDHQISSLWVKSRCTLDLPADTFKNSESEIRIQFDAKSRLIRVSSMNREPDWRMEGGFLLLRKSSLRVSSVPRESNTIVEIECLSKISDSVEIEVTDVTLPNFSIGQGCVLKGTTSIEIEKDVELRRVSTSSQGRLLETTNSKGMSFEWWTKPIDIDIGFSKRQRDSLSKLLYRVSGGGSSGVGGASTNVSSVVSSPTVDDVEIKARAIYTRVPESDVLLELEPGWTLLEVVQPTTKRNVPFEVLAGLGSGAEKIVIQKDDLPNIGLELDFRLLPPGIPSKQELTFPIGGWIRFSDSPRETILIAENMGRGWNLPTVPSDSWVGIDSLATNEKAFISYPEKSFAWLASKASTYTFTKRTFATRLMVDVETKIARVGPDTLKFEHFFYEESPLASVRPTFELPSVGWYSKIGGSLTNGTGPLLGTDTSGQSAAVIRLELPFIEDAKEDEGRWSVESRLTCASEGLVIPAPVFPANVQVKHRIRVEAPIEIDMSKSAGRWICDANGELLLDLVPGTETPSVKFRAASTAVASLLRQPSSTVEVIVDSNGKCRSNWKLVFPGWTPGDGLVQLETGWKVDTDTFRITKGLDCAWTEPNQEPNTFHVHFLSRSNSVSEDESVVLEFEAIQDAPLWSSRDNLLNFVVPLEIPSLHFNSKQVKSTGRLLVPESLPWQVISRLEDEPKTSWSLVNGAPWWKHAKDFLLFGSVQSSDGSIGVQKEKDDRGYWKTLFEWRNPSDEERVWITIASRVHWFSGLLFSIMFLGTIWTLPKRAWAIGMLVLVLSSLAIAMSAVDQIVLLPLSMSIAGCALGMIAASIARVVISPRKDRSDSIREDSVVAWDLLRSGAAIRAPSNQTIAKAVLFFLAAVGSDSISIAQSGNIPQSVKSLGQDLHFDLVFPTEESETSTSIVYVPDSLYSSLKGNSASSYILFSAKHQWRVASRMRSFAVVDQLSSTYELSVGAIGSPVEIPVRSNQIRFYVNDSEVAYGARLQRNLSNNTIVWSPEKPGKYKVQVVANLQADIDDSIAPLTDEPLITQSFDVSILPAGNAILEIELPDSQLQVELDTIGGTSNPSPGKLMALLGNVDKIQGRLKFPNSGFVGPVRNTSVTDFPTLCTEFLLSETIHARTVIHVPPSVTMESQFEMEVDGNWQPIGKAWGSIQLVDTLVSSSYSRNRYVFIDKSRGLVPKERASQLSILWGVRDPSAVTLNALFADCTDQRIRPSIMRYARMPEAAWSMEEVNTWSTVIGERERLDWPELTAINVNPRATSLRIPKNAGRGVLKKAALQTNAQARINTRWTVHSESQTILVRAEVIGALSGDYIEMDLPNGFVVTEARRRQGSFFVLQCEQERDGISTNRVQLLLDRLQADRLQWRDFDFSIRAEREGVTTQKETRPPTVVLHHMNTVEQTIELSASDRWRIHVQDQAAPVYGLGMNATVLTMTPDQRLSFDRRHFPAAGSIEHQFISQPESDKVQLTMSGSFEIHDNSSTRFIVEIPIWLEEYWNSDRSASLIPCPIADKVWLQVDLGQPNHELERREWSIQFSLIRDELPLLKSDPSSIRVLDSRLQAIPFSMEYADRDFPRVTDASFSTGEKLSAHVWTETSKLDNRSRLIRFWFDEWSPSLQWDIESKDDIASVRVQDGSVPWSWSNGVLSASIPRQASGWMYEVTIELQSTDSSTVVPKLRSTRPDINVPAPKELGEHRDLALSILLQALKDKLRPLPVKLHEGSFAARWLAFWGTKLNDLHPTATLTTDDLEQRYEHIAGLLEKRNPNFVRNREPSQSLLDSKELERESIAKLDWLYGLETGVFLFSALAVYGRWRNRPWWLLICVAILSWLMTGWILVAGVIIGAAAISAADTYWIRRTSKTISRSQRLRAS